MNVGSCFVKLYKKKTTTTTTKSTVVNNFIFLLLLPKKTTTTHYIVIFVSVCVAMFLVSCPKQEVGEGLGTRSGCLGTKEVGKGLGEKAWGRRPGDEVSLPGNKGSGRRPVRRSAYLGTKEVGEGLEMRSGNKGGRVRYYQLWHECELKEYSCWQVKLCWCVTVCHKLLYIWVNSLPCVERYQTFLLPKQLRSLGF